MKKLLMIFLLIGNFAVAEESKPETNDQKPQSTKMTTKDAKKTCKEQGKTGADLIECMKEKKNEK